MHPILTPGAILLLDRHQNILTPNRSASPTTPAAQAEPPPHLYAIRHNTELRIRYATLIRGRILLRPHNLAYPLELPEPQAGETYHDLIVGQVILILRPS